MRSISPRAVSGLALAVVLAIPAVAACASGVSNRSLALLTSGGVVVSDGALVAGQTVRLDRSA